MSTSPARSVPMAALAGYAVTAAVVVVIPMLLIPADQRSPYFWCKVGWAEFLTLVVWAYFGGSLALVVPSHARISGIGGILPSMGMVIVAYAVLSLVLVMVCSWPSTGHWAGQVLLLAAAVLLLLLLSFARSGAVAGAEPIPQGVAAPQDLAARLRMQEDRFWTSAADSPGRALSDALKALRETLQYSLPHVGRIGRQPEYLAFSGQLEQYCTSLQGVGTNAESELMLKFRDEAMQHRRQAEYLGSLLKTRPS